MSSHEHKHLSDLLHDLVKESKGMLEKEGLDHLTITEIHLSPAGHSNRHDAHAHDDPIICKNIKVGNTVRLVCKRASDW